MQAKIGSCVIELVEGDLTRQTVDAVVNAANAALGGGGGVDGAIHRAGGPAIADETSERYPDGCPTGSAVITGGGELPCRYVIHAVGPVWRGGMRGEAERLRSAHIRSLELAIEHDCRSVAFPALSTGAYGYPVAEAAEVALDAARRFLTEHGRPAVVRFVLFGERAYQAFAKSLGNLDS